MEETVICYGVKIRISIVQVEKISYDDLGSPGYAYQVVFNRKSEGGGNGIFDLQLIKDGKKIDALEFDGWKFKNFQFSYSWGHTSVRANTRNISGETIHMTLASGKGIMSSTRPTWEQVLKQAFDKIINITEKYNTYNMYKLCEEDGILMFSSSSFADFLRQFSEFSQKVDTIRRYLLDNPSLHKDIKAFNTFLIPKLKKYIKQLASDSLSDYQLDAENE